MLPAEDECPDIHPLSKILRQDDHLAAGVEYPVAFLDKLSGVVKVLDALARKYEVEEFVFERPSTVEVCLDTGYSPIYSIFPELVDILDPERLACPRGGGESHG